MTKVRENGAASGVGVLATFAYDGSGALLRRHVHGPSLDEPLVWLEGSGTADRRFLHADPRGSVIAVANASGTVTAKNRYDAYGAPAAGNIGRFQYTGQIFLAEAGLYHYKARAYHPELGRFLETDPIGYGDGLNLYAYVGNDPVNATDPSGLCSAEIASDCDDEVVVEATRKRLRDHDGGSSLACVGLNEFWRKYFRDFTPIFPHPVSFPKCCDTMFLLWWGAELKKPNREMSKGVDRR